MFKEKWAELLFYRRYIDDLMFIWAGSEPSLIEYLEILNRKNNSKLSSQWSKIQVNFLDVNIYRVNDLQTNVYFKPTDRNSFLSIPVLVKKYSKGADNAC